MNVIAKLLTTVATDGKLRPQAVELSSMGSVRSFNAYDVGADTFIFESGIASHLKDRPSVLIVPKRELGNRHSRGWVLTISTGNHSTAAFPLLDGRFWKLSWLRPEVRSATLAKAILCANVVEGKIELSQRDVPTEAVILADEWLTKRLELPLYAIVFGDRNPTTLEHYRRQGQEWRVKPLAWTDKDIRVALEASRKHITLKALTYYHSIRGIHFLTYADFIAFVQLARTDHEAFRAGMRELVGVFEGNQVSFMRLLRHRGHHEVELFGLPRGLAEVRIVPELEALSELVALGRINHNRAVERLERVVELYGSLLSDPALKDPATKLFRDAMYMHITGEVYAVVGIGATPAFDGRRTALPGATFIDGRPSFHKLADFRTRRLITNIRHMTSKDETIEYVNVYELHGGDETVKLGAGPTREISYKTNRRPSPKSLVEKRLSRMGRGYSSYMLCRIEALKSIGVRLSEYRILKSIDDSRHGYDYYIRRRCEGNPLAAIPKNYFVAADDVTSEDAKVVLALAALMGDAAAQNMAMCKYDPQGRTSLFGVGKEIYDFEFDLLERRFLPKSVSTCSIRGSFGWPDQSRTEANLRARESFYLRDFARALADFRSQHAVPMAKLAKCFFTAFESRTMALCWQATMQKDRFEAFHPGLAAEYDFEQRLSFLIWALEGQQRRLESARERFLKLTEKLENEYVRHNSK